jgi:hypothetical protein
MRLALGLALFVWLLCGLAGAWMLHPNGELGLKPIARGPLTLVEAFEQEPTK